MSEAESQQRLALANSSPDQAGVKVDSRSKAVTAAAASGGGDIVQLRVGEAMSIAYEWRLKHFQFIFFPVRPVAALYANGIHSRKGNRSLVLKTTIFR